MRARIFVLFLLLLGGCGKNDPIRPVGGYGPGPGQVQPPVQAPPPPGNFQPQPYPNQYPQNPFPQPMGPIFYPQMPPQYPAQYTPFIPIDNYFRQNPRLAPYWPQFWNQWQNYSYRNHISTYDFSRFWFDFCPNQWQNTQLAPVYNYFDQNFYYWTEPQMDFVNVDVSVDYSNFWGNYSGWSFDGCYDSCGGYY